MSEGDFSPEIPLPSATEKQPLSSTVRLGGKTAASSEHPHYNEDSLFHSEEFQMAGVFDGVGGEAGGKAAAIIAQDTIAERLKRIDPTAPPEGVKAVVISALIEANEKILEGPVKRGQTTASAIKLWLGPQGERKAIITNLGDSRIYKMGADGFLRQITEDDNLTQQAAKKGKITPEQARKIDQCTDLGELTREERDRFERRNEITQALGVWGLTRQTVEERTRIVDLRPGEKLLLCTDGVHDNLTDQEIAERLSSKLEPHKKAANLVGVAKHRSQQGMVRSKLDDITAIVIEV